MRLPVARANSCSMPPERTLAARSGYGACSEPAITPCFSRSLGSRRSTSTTSCRSVSESASAASEPRDLVLGEAHAHVRRHCDVHHLWIGKIEMVHQLDILVD